MTVAIKNSKNFSMAKVVLASLWKLNEAGREKLFSYRYVKILAQDKHKTTYRTCLSRLLRQGYVRKDYNDIFCLTESGRKEALPAFIEAEVALYKKGNEVWDGGWRMVFFDIPESKRSHRDYLRKVLKTVGFHEFQRSIWVYPFPVPSFLGELLFGDEIKSHIRFITTNKMDNDSDLRKIFNL
jgi:phenylacetic acid degradation operon negative regulatory protein